MAKKCKLVGIAKKEKYKVREVSRCPLCGRSRAYLRFFDMCRICFRKSANEGLLPGVTKSSF